MPLGPGLGHGLSLILTTLVRIFKGRWHFLGHTLRQESDKTVLWNLDLRIPES